MNIIKFDDRCTGCKACYKACWLDVIRWNDATGRPFSAYPEDCVDCNYCETCCPTGSIHVNIDYKKPMPRSY